MPAKTPPHIISEAIALYSSGLSSTEISSRLKSISASAVCRYAREAGVIRNQSEAKKEHYTRNPRAIKPVAPGIVCGVNIGGHKECAACGTAYPANFNNFYKRRRDNGKVYLSSVCKECIKSDRVLYRANNPEKMKELNRQSRIKHGDVYNQNKREKFNSNPELRAKRAENASLWYQANKSYANVQKRAWSEQNRERMREAGRKNIAANRERYRSYGVARKARQRNAPGTFTGDDVKLRFQEQSGRCFWCRKSIEDEYHIDHYLPLARGGTNHAYNIVLACPRCNTSRRHKLPVEFFAYMREMAAAERKVLEKRNKKAA